MIILEIQGIKCSSKSFQIEIELKQMMVLQPSDIFEKCLIKPKEVSYNLPIIENTKIEEEEIILGNEENIDTVIDTINAVENAENNIDNNENYLENIEEKNNNTKTLENIKPNIQIDENELLEVDFHLEELKDTEPISIKKRDNIYYEMYREAKKKAKVARDLALSTYMEAKRIKNTYLLEDLEDDDDDDDDDQDEDDDDEDDEDDDDENDEDNIDEKNNQDNE
jgi:hypothetical protein